MTGGLQPERAEVDELVPLVRRVVSLDPASLVRLRRSGERLTAYVRLPFDVLAARTVRCASAGSADRTVRADDLVAWFDSVGDPPPTDRSHEWRGSVPPVTGWSRVDRVPDSVVRPLVRSGALALKEAAAREGVPDAQPRAEVSDALLDSVVLTVTEGAHRVELTLRTISAVTRLGFLPRDSAVAVDVVGRWVRVAAPFGSVFAERVRPGSRGPETAGLSLL